MIQLKVEGPFHIDKPFKHVKRDSDITKKVLETGRAVNNRDTRSDLKDQIATIQFVKYPKYCADKTLSHIFYS